MQIVLTRDHVSVPWGFRLKGGAEYSVPLSILKVIYFLFRLILPLIQSLYCQIYYDDDK